MRVEYTEPAAIAVPKTGNMSDDIVENAHLEPGRVVISRPVDETWEGMTAQQFLDDVIAVAKGIIANGVQPGERIGIMSRTRYEWTLVDYATWFAGAVNVPIYETSSAEQIQWILADSGAVAVFLETHQHKSAFDEVAVDIPDVTRVWVFDDDVLDRLRADGIHISDADVHERRRLATPGNPATIIYTSGTTGRPKGCTITHGNLMFEVDNVANVLSTVLDAPGASTLLFLPIAHVLGRVIQCVIVKRRALLGHSPDLKNLVPDLQSFHPTLLLAVPRVFERVYNGAEQKAQADGKGKIFALAVAVAQDYSRSLDAGGPGLVLRLKHAIFDRLVYGKLRAAVGGNVQWAVSGGAPLGERLGHFFRGIGITILEGYGLTETTAATNVNWPGAIRIGTVGRPIPGTSVRLGPDGELLYRGGQVISSYWNNPTATSESIDPEGWFHTGDLGEIDDDGYVRITGRKKEILVTAGGKNVVPALLEDRIRSHWLVSQCLVVGDARPFVAALVTIDPDALPAWLSQHGRPASTSVAEIVDDPDLRATIQDAIDLGNKAVSHAEAIKKFVIVPNDWSESSGEMTPSMKLKRKVIMEAYAPLIEAIYH